MYGYNIYMIGYSELPLVSHPTTSSKVANVQIFTGTARIIEGANPAKNVLAPSLR
jgi:hypothetical protein